MVSDQNHRTKDKQDKVLNLEESDASTNLVSRESSGMGGTRKDNHMERVTI